MGFRTTALWDDPQNELKIDLYWTMSSEFHWRVLSNIRDWTLNICCINDIYLSFKHPDISIPFEHFAANRFTQILLGYQNSKDTLRNHSSNTTSSVLGNCLAVKKVRIIIVDHPILSDMQHLRRTIRVSYFRTIIKQSMALKFAVTLISLYPNTMLFQHSFKSLNS